MTPQTRTRPEPTGTDMVVLDGVSKTFRVGSRSVTAVDDVSLTIRRGEIYAIIGYSGAGKSTLVRLINGLETVTSGTLTVDGQEISGAGESRLRRIRTEIGMIFQQFNLMNSKTVAANVEFPLKIAGWSKERRRARVAELLEFVGLADKAKSHPDQLSGGQKQRVGIARALATEPHLLLADESTSALDPETTEEVLDLLKRVNEDLGITIVVITHEMDVVAKIADRVAVMEKGRVVEEGNVYDVFSDPQTAPAQRFVSTTVKQAPTGDEAKELKARHRGHLVNVEIHDQAEVGQVLSRLGERGVTFTVVQGGLETLQGRTYGRLTLELLGEITAIDAAVEQLKLVTTVKEVRA